MCALGDTATTPAARDFTDAAQTCPLPHCHHTRRVLPQTTWSGVSGPFLSGCHWAASAGSWEARSLNPGQGRFPAQYGQPLSAPVRV